MSADDCPPGRRRAGRAAVRRPPPAALRLAPAVAGAPRTPATSVRKRSLRAAQSIAIHSRRGSARGGLARRVLINICRDGWRRTAVRRRLEPLRLADTVTQSGHLEQTFIAQTTIWRALERSSPSPARRRGALRTGRGDHPGDRDAAGRDCGDRSLASVAGTKGPGAGSSRRMTGLPAVARRARAAAVQD
mgnify:CR=1 FL=1